MDKETHLNLRQVPEDLLPALENHLSEIDSAKKASGAQPRWVWICRSTCARRGRREGE